MRGAPQRFVNRRLAWFDRMDGLPVVEYALTRDDEAYLDLAPALRRSVDGDEVHVVAVDERIAFEGYRRRPQIGSLLLTVVRRGDRWSVVADDGLDDLGLFSARNVWDFARVDVFRSDTVMVIHHDQPGTAARIAGGVEDAIERVAARWSLRWPERAVVMIPRSSNDLARIFETTVDLSPFVAFAASDDDRPDGGYRATGTRVYLQPDTYFRQPASFQVDVLSHELLHVAAAVDTGYFTPAWLDEGVAQVYGERSLPPEPRLRQQVAAGTFVGRLPEVHEFFLGTSDEIQLSYESSSSLVDYVRDRFGQEAPARFYAAVGAESPVAFGTARYHLDRASRAVFEIGFDRLERAWLRHIDERFG